MAEGDGAFEAQKLSIAAEPKAPAVDMTEYRFTAVSQSSQPENLGFSNLSLTEQPKKPNVEADNPEAFKAVEAKQNEQKQGESSDTFSSKNGSQLDKRRAATDVRAGDPSGPGGEAQEPTPETFKATTAADAKRGGIAAGLDGATQAPLRSPSDTGSQNRSSMQPSPRMETWSPSMFEAQSPVESITSKQNDKT